MEIAIMIEGQNGLNWQRWQRIARTVEDCGFSGLYRSDHITNPAPPDIDSLEMWASLTWLASHTSKLEFGPLVSPVSLRHPVVTARTAAAVDDLSGGRLTLGMGAGWTEREHANFGFDLLDVSSRFRRLEEALEVVTRLLRSAAPSSFSGSFYRLEDATLLPRPQRPGGPRLLIGGNGPIRTLPLAARYADEWNAVYIPPARFQERSRQLDELLKASGRGPASVKRSLMTGCFFARDPAGLRDKLSGRPAEDMRKLGVVIGSGDEVREQLAGYEEAGVQRIMLQWLDQDDLAGLEALAAAVLPV